MSASADSVLTNPLDDAVTALVARVAHDDDDRRMLLEALGLAPTVDVLAATA